MTTSATKTALAATGGVVSPGGFNPCCAGPVLHRPPRLWRGRRDAADTATVRLHISKMTCGSCPATARLALKRLPGVYRATVTLDDSLGVVRYDPQQVSPAQIAAHLTRLTGFGATILPDTTRAPGGGQ